MKKKKKLNVLKKDFERIYSNLLKDFCNYLKIIKKSILKLIKLENSVGFIFLFVILLHLMNHKNLIPCTPHTQKKSCPQHHMNV